MPRVTDWSVDPETAEAEAKAVALFGHVSDLFAALGHAPTVLSGWIDLVRRLRTDLSVDPRLHELVVVRVAGSIGATYAETAHRRLALKAGVRQEQLDAIDLTATAQTSAEFDDTERAALLLAAKVAAATAGPDDVLTLMELIGERDATELLVIAAFYCCVGRITNALGVVPMGGG
ncbi:carboxymuconolactone decarboxylase family protein [Nakamurella alba]|uniref:carboxymuconolactone decarboxylase family protein n=1 Tax=Nakamurella alba TaxID=2665158 RepID=UPI0018A9EACD|nr:carboxymuconolactone decarboxylase family protein [Nakamurella alba]